MPFVTAPMFKMDSEIGYIGQELKLVSTTEIADHYLLQIPESIVVLGLACSTSSLSLTKILIERHG